MGKAERDKLDRCLLDLLGPPDYHAIIPLRARVKPSGVDVTTRGKPHAYHSQGYTEWAETFAYYLCADGRPERFTGDLCMDVAFRFKLKGPAADADNLLGGVLDACEGILYDNDKQVTDGFPHKRRHTGKDEIEVALWRL